MSGQYALYLKYRGVNDGSTLNFKMSTKHALLDEWYTHRNIDDGTEYIIELPTSGDGEEVQTYRILFVDPSSQNYIPPAEKYLKLSFYVETYGETTDASLVVNLLSAIRPADYPYQVSGVARPNTGDLKVTVIGGTDTVWKLFHDSDTLYQNSGTIRTSLGVGSQYVIIRSGANAPYDYYYSFVEVTQDRTAELNYTIS
jgi:hypothetical protein